MKKFVGAAHEDSALPQHTPCSRPFVYTKYHVQDAWNCITCLRIKASKTLNFSLSQNRIRLRALVGFT